ncbi:MAG: hypothetical protein CM15mP102_21670 [Flavobacteriales bacterium]|nr:MAG: hypothetical protein CM15mP102_21670 [Flavobacteriales bacterium]
MCAIISCNWKPCCIFNVNSCWEKGCNDEKWDAGEAIKLIHEEKISDITGVPTQTWELLNHPDRDKYDLSSLRTLGGGGGPSSCQTCKIIG